MLRSVRVRAFLGTALAALIAFGGGALWLRGHVHESMMDTARAQAVADSQAIAAEFAATGTSVASAFPKQSEVWWIALTADGSWFMAGARFAPVLSHSPQNVRDGDILVPREDTIRTPFTVGFHMYAIPQIDGDSVSGDETVEVVFWSDVSGNFLEPGGAPGEPVDAAYTTVSTHPAGHPEAADDGEPSVLSVWVLASSEEADAAVAVLDRALGFGVPLLVLFVAGIAWLVTGHALRPVERIRRTMAAINARETDHRVSVPTGDDEISRLARTTNDTLDRLAHALARQREFVADASHELRSPIAGLRNAVEIGLRYEDDTDWRERAEGLLEDAIRLQALTDDLLLLARLDDAPVDTQSTVDLSGPAAEQIAERRHLGDGSLVYQAEADTPATVPGDEPTVARILRNLLDNAERHADGVIAVSVVVGDEDDTVTLVVEDDGPGIPAADRERVFERFTRLDDARGRDSGGSGLGLAIVRDLVTGLGGHVVADEPLELTGACFVVTLPSARARVSYSGPVPGP
ncbi:HAMP domain-containing sensor histidine kinase [Phytomonospora sp. NPDC050363]|uniref:sensor histidine kinase n=1 Tax=Phytomonospora sp. NPDC050363 TaxID=3155642 RepID=UPI0034011FDE